MTLALVRQWARTGTRPPRDIVLAFVSDEEAGGRQGAHYLVDNHRRPVRRLHRGDQRGRRLQRLAQRHRAPVPDPDRREGHQLAAAAGRPAGPGTARWCTRTTRSPGSPAAVSRIGALRVARSPSPTPYAPWSRRSPTRPAWTSTPTSRRTGCPSSAAWPGWSARWSATPPTRRCWHAGYKANVIPSSAEATIDARFLPGMEDELLKTDRRADRRGRRAGASTSATSRSRPAFDGALVDAMVAALRAEDPDAHPVPYLMSGGTDAKSFSTLGIRCFGFSPLLLAAGPGLPVAVPRHRRAGAGRRAAVRRTGARPVPVRLLIPNPAQLGGG